MDFFVRIGSHRFAGLDVWEITLEDDGALAREFDGFLCWMQAIPATRLYLAERDVIAPQEPPAPEKRVDTQGESGALVAFETWTHRDSDD